jgi:hypothetical protein
MKDSKIFFLCLLLLLACPGFAQVNTVVSPDGIVGQWKLEPEIVLSDMEPSKKALYDTLSFPQRERFHQSLHSRVFEFGEGGSFSATWESHGKQLSVKGDWELKGQGNLSITLPSGIYGYSIHEVSGDRLVLRPKKRSGGLINGLFFTKTEEQ